MTVCVATHGRTPLRPPDESGGFFNSGCQLGSGRLLRAPVCEHARWGYLRAMPDQTPSANRASRGRTVALLAGCGALLLNTACYAYLPALGGTVPTGSDVRIELTATGTSALQSAVGPRVRFIEGHVQLADSDGNASVIVERLTSLDGLAVNYLGRDPVRITRADVAKADLRTLDRKRSWVAAGVMGGVFLVAVVTALAKARSRASGDPGRIGGSPPDIRAPLIVP